MTSTDDPGERWRQALAAWAIPEPILAQAPDDPWRLPVALFEAEAAASLTRSHQRAREALRSRDDVLDVGAGRCAMSLPLRPPAARIVAVDSSQEMLDSSPADVTVLGTWPDVAAQAGKAAVVICGHVLYNIPDLRPFIEALAAAAQRRVVIEITEAHPRTRSIERALWKHFWQLERPTGPTWKDAQAVLQAAGIEATVESWQSEQRWGFSKLDDLVIWMRRTVCLPASRDPEVREIVRQYAVERDGRWRLSSEPRSLVTLWWDVPSVA